MHGFCHVEIPTTDAKKSGEFYRKLFNWEIDESNPDYLMFSTPGNDGGGFTTSSKPSKEGVIVYIEAEDIESKLKEIETAGAKIIKGKTGISPEFGFFALFADPSGNTIGLWGKK